MKTEIREFLDEMMALDYDEEVQPLTLLECAGVLYEWQHCGCELPDGITPGDLYDYIMELAAKTKKPEKPVRPWKIKVSEVREADYIVEARTEEEAEEIFGKRLAFNQQSIRDSLESTGVQYCCCYSLETGFTSYECPTIKWKTGKALLES